MKSSRSRTAEPSPKGINHERRLLPSAQGSARINISTTLIAQAFFLDQPKRSILQEMMFSKTAITVESAANDMNTKNNAPQNLPPGILLNMLGRVMKISEGPASG